MREPTAIRPLELDESGQVRGLLREVALWSEAFGRRVWQEDELDGCASAASLPEGRWFGAFDRQGLVACMRIDTSDPVHWPDDPPGEAVYVHKVAVARRAAGQGWTARLIGFAADVASGLGARFLRLDTLPREKLIGLYRGLGFRLVDEGPRPFAGRTLVRMERELGTRRRPQRVERGD
jgi:GNAT superfamily N-acetyltransferase